MGVGRTVTATTGGEAEGDGLTTATGGGVGASTGVKAGESSLQPIKTTAIRMAAAAFTLMEKDVGDDGRGDKISDDADGIGFGVFQLLLQCHPATPCLLGDRGKCNDENDFHGLACVVDKEVRALCGPSTRKEIGELGGSVNHREGDRHPQISFGPIRNVSPDAS